MDYAQRPIERLAHDYAAKYDSMRNSIGRDIPSWRDPVDGKELNLDGAVNKASERLLPLEYSLDVVWGITTQKIRDRWSNIPEDMGLGGRVHDVTTNLDQLEKLKVIQQLKDWSLAADPFIENPDENAVLKRGDVLLKGLEDCYRVIRAGPNSEMLPDLMAITKWVGSRITVIEAGGRSQKEAKSVPHQMYLELRDTITRSMDQIKVEVQDIAKRVRDNPEDAIEDWNNTLQERVTDFARKGYHDKPYEFWQDMVDDVFQGAAYGGHQVPSCAADLRTLFNSRNFESQLDALNKTIKGDRKAKDYVLKVRDAAWSVQNTMEHYLRGIAATWAPSGEGERQVRDWLTGNLCVLQDRLLKDLNFIITTQLARG